MSEALRQASPESLDGYLIDGRSLRDWHTYLTTDEATGEPLGWLETPGSRYGTTSDECAWFAVAGEIAFVNANGIDDRVEVSLDELMGLAVNDSPDIADIVYEAWPALPRELRQELGGKTWVRRLRA